MIYAYNEVDENNQYQNKVFNFDIDFKNFADDSGMDTIALPIKTKLTDKIKRDYRLAMQLATLQTKKKNVVQLTRSWLLEYISFYIDCMTSCQLYVIL